MLDVKILGTPPNDNALFVTANNGKSQTKLLFDCGADTVSSLPIGDIQSIEHLFLSHMHMDHISGFDAFFRVNFGRQNMENHIWGPTGSAAILQHRFQGFWWSHAAELKGTWFVHDVDSEDIHDYRFEANEAFAICHDEGSRPNNGVLVETGAISVSAISLKHHGLCLGFVGREPVKQNISSDAMAKLGLKPGPWLAKLKQGDVPNLEIDGVTFDCDDLRGKLMKEESGDSFAYLTDFSADEEQRVHIAPYLSGVRTLYAEAQYAIEDAALAVKYHHSTVDQIARLAKTAGVEHYTLLHLSRRYSPQQWREMRDCAQAIFPKSNYIPEWELG
jgi:ribonuclease Z